MRKQFRPRLRDNLLLMVDGYFFRRLKRISGREMCIRDKKKAWFLVFYTKCILQVLRCLQQLPNFAYSIALAHFQISLKSGDRSLADEAVSSFSFCILLAYYMLRNVTLKQIDYCSKKFCPLFFVCRGVFACRLYGYKHHGYAFRTFQFQDRLN